MGKVDLKKVAIICSPGLDGHLAEVSDHFKANYETRICVTNDLEQTFNAAKWADIIWIEWADQSAINVTRFEQLLYQKQVILRLHSYEAFTSYLDYIKWGVITDLVFVAEHIKDIVLKKYPVIKSSVDRIHVISNGVDVDKFNYNPLRSTKHFFDFFGKDLAYLGYLNFKKGSLLLFTAFAELLEIDPEYTLHIGGTFQEERYALYLEQMQKQNPLMAKQIKFDGWVENPAEWLKDKSHIICTSVLESQGKGIMEAMSMGLKPVIHNFVGANTIYPKKYLWNTAHEFCQMILHGEYHPEEYRKYITDNFLAVDKIQQIEDMIVIAPEHVPVFMPDDLVKPIKLSVAMMMRDEEKHIAKVLESVKDIADEIIIVDTGSTDKSIKIAKSFGPKIKIYNHPWEDDFSLHRNQGIGYCSGDWILIIDADEELVGEKEGLKETLSKLSPEYNGVSLKCQDDDKDSGTEFNSARVFRNGFIKYQRAVHNKPIYEGKVRLGCVLFDDATIVHYGAHFQISEEEAVKKTKRTGGLLLKALKDDPEDYELLFYLMQFYGTTGDIDSAVLYGEKYLASKPLCVGFNESVYFSIVRLYFEKKDYEKSLRWLREAQAILPDDLDIAYVSAELAVATGNGPLLLEGARAYLKQYDVYTQRPDAKGSRFIFSLKPNCLYFVLKHMTAYLLGDGVNCLNKLKQSVGGLSNSDRLIAVKEVRKILEPIGVSTN